MQRNVYLKLTGLAEARKLWLAAVGSSPLGAETISLREAHGRTLATAAVAGLSSPAFHGAAMDGIAVRAADTFGASEHRPKTLHIGKNAHWINTGHPMPPGTNSSSIPFSAAATFISMPSCKNSSSVGGILVTASISLATVT